MNLRLLMFHERPNTTFITASLVLSVFALTFEPSFISTIILLSILLIYSSHFVRRQHNLRNAVLLWFSVTAGRSSTWILPSLHALSTPSISVLALFLISGSTSAIALFAILVFTRLRTRVQVPWIEICLFPAIWAATWWGVSYISPVGRLALWSPVLGTEPYRWATSLFGPIMIDWVTAAWAVVCSQAVEMWAIGSKTPEERPLIEHESAEDDGHEKKTSSHGLGLLSLGAILIALAVPSFVYSDLPARLISSSTTALGVGCVLPPLYRYKHHSPTFEDYIDESKKLQSSAKILLWPEGAVIFADEAERDAAFQRVRETITGSYVGVSYEETFSDPRDPNGRGSLKRTAIALISNSSTNPHFVYHKRHLVPIAESFSLSHSTTPPPIYTLNLPNPKGWNKTDWAPAPNYTRPIPLTASICLDFAMPSPFDDLPSKPALILAPARTWDTSVGHVMWQQARQRAEELDTMILWCDGGKGGVSGIAGKGYHEIFEAGEGSWSRNVGIGYPFKDQRTIYARLGDWFTILLIWGLVLGTSMGPFIRGFPLDRVYKRLAIKLHGAYQVLSEWRDKKRESQRRQDPATQDLLA